MVLLVPQLASLAMLLSPVELWLRVVEQLFGVPAEKIELSTSVSPAPPTFPSLVPAWLWSRVTKFSVVTPLVSVKTPPPTPLFASFGPALLPLIVVLVIFALLLWL